MKPARLSDLCARFDLFLLDQFGVLIDGNGPYPGAVAAVEQLIALDKTVIVLTNSGKRSAHTAKRLRSYGFPTVALTVVSSGEVARDVLAERIDHSGPVKVWYEAENRIDTPLEGLDATFTTEIDGADMVLIAGVRTETARLDDYRHVFSRAIARGLRCLCTNPDIERLTAQGVRFAPGRVAQLYEELGGHVDWVGKPHGAIYRHALRQAPAGARTICIGDSVAHDIRGAADAGLASALVRTGLHAELSPDELRDLCRRESAVPDSLLTSFTLD